MSRYVRLFSVVTGEVPDGRIFDLADGSLNDSYPVGRIGNREVWSAEALLCTIEAYTSPTCNLFIKGVAIDDWRNPDPIEEGKQ